MFITIGCHNGSNWGWYHTNLSTMTSTFKEITDKWMASLADWQIMQECDGLLLPMTFVEHNWEMAISSMIEKRVGY